MANIVAIKLADTFSILKDRINEIITKLNKITVDENSTTLTMVTTQPTTASSSGSGTAVLWVDSSTNPPELKVTINVSGTRTIYKLTKTTA